jgi:adhesin transport system outer membrane protein
MPHNIRVSAIALFLGLTWATVLQAASLQEIVRETVETNPDVLIANSERNTVEQQMEQARAGFFPQVDITVGSGWEHSDNPTTRASGDNSRDLHREEAEILVRQLLFDGQGTESEFQRQRARVNSRAYESFNTAELTALRAVEVYLDVLKEQQLVELAEHNLDNHQKTYDRIVKRGESGVGSKADVQQALGRLALAKTNLMAEENRLDDAIASFVNVVGHQPEGLVEPDTPQDLVPATIEELIETALDNHPTMKIAESDVIAAEQQYNAAKALFYPRIHLELQGSHNENIDGLRGDNNDTLAMFRGRYNFTGGKDIARRQETISELQQAKEIRDRTRREIIESVQLSWNAYETSKAQLEYFKTHVDASKAALVAYRKQFNLGQRSLLDVLDQENEVFQARINYVNGKTEVAFSTYRILAGVGKLMWALEVPLPEEADTIQEL